MSMDSNATPETDLAKFLRNSIRKHSDDAKANLERMGHDSSHINADRMADRLMGKFDKFMADPTEDNGKDSLDR